jgi:hypothetical protein
LQQIDVIKAAKVKAKVKDGPTPPPAPPRKEPVQVRAGTLVSKPYMESEEDIEAYLAVLRQKLSDALAEAGRVRVL